MEIKKIISEDEMTIPLTDLKGMPERKIDYETNLVNGIDMGLLSRRGFNSCLSTLEKLEVGVDVEKMALVLWRRDKPSLGWYAHRVKNPKSMEAEYLLKAQALSSSIKDWLVVKEKKCTQ